MQPVEPIISFFPGDAALRKLFRKARTIAVVGLSPDPDRPSHRVARYLLEAGYAIFPINPGCGEILGLPCFPDLDSLPMAVDIVDVFRKPEAIPLIVEASIRIGAGALWLQEGVVHAGAAAIAQQAGMLVVMDRCIKKEHARLAAFSLA